MKTIGYVLLSAAFLGYLMLLVFGLLHAMHFGWPGLLGLAGVGFLLLHVLCEEPDDEDQYYKDNVVK